MNPYVQMDHNAQISTEAVWHPNPNWNLPEAVRYFESNQQECKSGHFDVQRYLDIMEIKLKAE